MEVLKIGLFSLIFALLFPVFTYGLTNLTNEEPTAYDLLIPSERFHKANIEFYDSSSKNVTWNGSSDFNITLDDVRVYWDDRGLLYGDGFTVKTQTMAGEFFNLWGGIWESDLSLISRSTNKIYRRGIDNATVIAEYDPEYNWTRFGLDVLGAELFFSTEGTGFDTITDAVNGGRVLVSVVTLKDTDDVFSAIHFVRWYWDTLTGKNYDSQFPGILAWIMRLQALISFVSAVVVARELTKL